VADLGTLRGWLDNIDVPEGLRVEADLRWGVLQSLVALGAAGAAEIDAELDGDRTASGEREAALARALIPTPESKAETWRRLVHDHALPNWLQRAMLQGFQHSAQVELTLPYAAEFFTVVADVWERRDGDPAQEFAQLAYPSYQVTDETVARSDAWIAQRAEPTPLRRLIAEGRDGVVRALRARVRDTATG
jgi:aminopeptidase N